MQKLNLWYYKHGLGNGNFGDELNIFLLDKMINKEKYELTYNTKGIKDNLIFIGSFIHRANNNCNIFGSGIRTQNCIEGKHKYKTLKVHAVRGQLTKKFLEKKNIKIPDIFGDPALLLPQFYEPTINTDLNNKIGIVPHLTNYKHYVGKIDTKKFHLINPIDKWQNVINQICSCKAVISSSLHGLICSDAYNIPNLWIDQFKLHEGDFKFKDYFASQGRKYVKITKLSEYKENLLYKEGNKVDLDKLLKAFPFK